jgi:hypothetical protein
MVGTYYCEERFPRIPTYLSHAIIGVGWLICEGIKETSGLKGNTIRPKYETNADAILVTYHPRIPFCLQMNM